MRKHPRGGEVENFLTGLTGLDNHVNLVNPVRRNTKNEGWRGTGRWDIFALFDCFWAAKVLLFALFQGKRFLRYDL